MPRKAHRSRRAPIVEVLEGRALLSALAQMANPGGVSASAAAEAARAVLVRTADGTAPGLVQRFYRSLGATVERNFPDGPTLLRLPSQAARDAAVAKLGSRPWVVYAEPDTPLVRAAADRVIPDDPSFSQLWGLDNPDDRDINAPEAWAAGGGGEGVIVAVLDTGVDLGHPELAGRVWTNPREVAGNGRDDDGNGLADDVHGWNFVASTANVQDDNGHGTHVSGTIAAAVNNGVGVAGVAYGATIMPLKVLDAEGGGSTSDAVAAIYYAAANGARVINASWGGPGYSKALDDAIRSVGQANPAAGRPGVVFVSAAGNDGVNNDVRPSYPTNNRHPSTIAVAALDQSGRLASYSNYGARTVDLAAPGDRIVSTVPGGYASYSGTSMATPHVSGVVALAAARHPGETAAQLVRRVVDASRPLPGLAGAVATGGIVDAVRAVGAPAPSAPIPTTPTTSTPTPTPTPTPTTPTPTPTTPTPTPTPATPADPGTVDPLLVSPRPVSGTAGDAIIRATLVSSDEFYARVGGTPEAFVEAIYRLGLGRSAEPAGLAMWASRLRSGGPRLDVATGILDSDEARRVIVAGWYRSDLGRPQPVEQLKYDPGVAAWAAQLGAGARPDAVRAAILGSAEFAARSGGTPDGLVVGVYRALLGRDPNAATRAAIVAQFTSGSWDTPTMILAVQTFEEASRTKVASWYRSDLGRPASVADLKSDAGVAFWSGMLARG